MALTEPQTDPRGLKELLADESGSATVEFLVLLPAYLVFLIGSFQLCWLVMAHQACQQAARVDGWIEGKNTATLFVGYMGDYSAEATRESNPGFANDDFETGATHRNLLRSLLENDFGQGGHPIVHRQRDVNFLYRGVILGGQTVNLGSTSSVYVFNDQFQYPKHQGNTREHFFGQENPLNPAYDPSDGPNNHYLSRRINQHFSQNEGIWDRSPQTGRIDGSVQAEHDSYRPRRP